MWNPFRKKPKQEAQKSLANAYEILDGIPGKMGNEKRRGLAVYTMSQLVGITGRDRDGRSVSTYYEQSVYYLTIEERNAIARLCTPVAGIITSRMNRIAGLKWSIKSEKEEEDMWYENLKAWYGLFKEYEKTTDLKYAVARLTAAKKIQQVLPDVLPDLSNFRQSLMRWKKRIKMLGNDRAKEVEDWLIQPNINDNLESFMKKCVSDLMIHGNAAIYKEPQSGRVENIYLLPGGTTFPVKSPYVTGVDAYVQIAQGMQPLIYFSDEVSFLQYLPTTSRSYGNIPMEALINKIAESLQFDKLMAEQADGTIPPNKILVIGENNPFGALTENFVPLDDSEVKRIQTKVNQPEKGGTVVFSGNTATILDLTRENTMQYQMQRQKDIREEVGLVFNASNMEMNLTGAENTSGRETSETQQEISEGRGIIPICNTIEYKINHDILPFRFGAGWHFEFQKQNEIDELTKVRMMMETGVYGVNEIRQDELSLDPFSDEAFDKPQGGGQQQQGTQTPEGREANKSPFAGLL